MDELRRKLGIKPLTSVRLVNAPREYSALSQALNSREESDVTLIFSFWMHELEAEFSECRATMAIDGGIWICWPKRASKVPTDLGDNVIREFGLGHGLVDNKVCSIDSTWSALRFVIRRADRV